MVSQCSETMLTDDGEHGPIFTALNRNKKAINLNIKKPEDKAVLEALLEEADVFIHNVRMAGVERLGFGYEAVKASGSK